MVKVKSRIPLEYLKKVIPPPPVSSSDGNEDVVVAEPQPGTSGAGSNFPDTKIQDDGHNNKCEDVVDSSGTAGGLELLKPKEDDIPVPEPNLGASTVVHNSRAVYSNWKAQGKGGVMKMKRARYCNLDVDFLNSRGIPSKFEIIQVSEKTETTPNKVDQNIKGIGTTPSNLNQNVEGIEIETTTTKRNSNRRSVQGETEPTAIKTTQNLQVDADAHDMRPNTEGPCSSILSTRSTIKNFKLEPQQTHVQYLQKPNNDHIGLNSQTKLGTPEVVKGGPIVNAKDKSVGNLDEPDNVQVKGAQSVLEFIPEPSVSASSSCPPQTSTSLNIDVTGSIFELEQDEITAPKGARKVKLPSPPEFPNNPDWINPVVLLEELWDKKQTLRSTSDPAVKFILPNKDIILNSTSWEIPGLIGFKNKLNEVKSTLDYFPLDEWHAHTKKMNVAHLVMSYVKRFFNPEFSSQAWGKMFEILCAFEVIPPRIVDEAEDIIRKEGNEKIPFDSIHLCEAPGAFVSALNHFLKISYPPVDWNWLATTLNPYHENNNVGKMVNDDRLILMSLNRWTFLKDNTGNILSKDNLIQLATDRDEKLINPRNSAANSEETKGENTRPSHVLLVTADGSIDCQSNPADQEVSVAHLHFAEIVSALMVLEKTGTFVLKIFTFLEAPTICHLYLLSCVFKEVTLFKPATSREGNSEVYVVCLGYLGKDCLSGILDTLIDNVEKYEDHVKNGVPLFPLSAIPKFFMDRIEDSATFFCNYQIKIIKRNASCFPCDTRVYLAMKPYRKEVAEQWIEWSSIHPLAKKHRLFAHDANESHATHKLMPKFMNTASHVDVRNENGCFADKLVRMNGTVLQKFDLMRQDLSSYEIWKGPQNHTLFGGVYRMLNVIFEKSYTNIRCSRFCTGRLLSTREEFREIIQPYRTVLEMNGLGDMGTCSACSGHDPQRVYETMKKHCDLGLQQLDCVCFLKMTWNLVGKTDFDEQKEDLNKLFEEVNALEKERSLFLCRFPLITRLQCGIIYCLSGVFEKVIIYSDQKKNVTGVLLYNYNGFMHPDQKRLYTSMEDVLTILNEFCLPVLEFAPMKVLLEFFPADFLIQYNTLLITQDMLRTINVVEGILKFIEKKFPQNNITM